MITPQERERIIRMLELAVSTSVYSHGEAISALWAVRRLLAAHNVSLADALIDREALALLRETQAQPERAAAVYDPLSDFEG